MGYVGLLVITIALLGMTMAKPMSKEVEEFYAKLMEQIQAQEGIIIVTLYRARNNWRTLVIL